MAAPKYPPEIREAVKTLHIEGLSSAAIVTRLREGTAGLEYRIDPSERTIDKWRRDWRREGIRAGFNVGTGQLDPIEDGIYRRLLGLYRSQLDRCERLAGQGKLEGKHAAALRSLQGTVDGARAARAAVARRDREPTGKESVGASGRASGKASDRSLLEQLARAERAGELEDTGPDRETVPYKGAAAGE